jgi:amino acid transporter, AAT family
MATTADTSAAGADRTVPDRTLPWWAFGLANVAVIAVLSVVSWWLLVDPSWSPLGAYPQPYTATLFWTIISTVWVAFNFEWLGPVGMRQPARGLVAMLLALALGSSITFLLAHLWGHFDPTFAAAREGGAGYTTGNLIVLFAFFFFVTVAVNWSHWPFAAGSVGQPHTGLAEVGVLMVPTFVLFAIFVLPNLATWAVPGTALMSVPTLIGWYYCVIVSVVVTGVALENWPWRLAGSPAAVMPASVVGNLVVGTVFYYVLLTVAKLLMGPANVAAFGPAVTVHAAELGVCWVVWMVAWANAFGNPPGGGRGLAATFAVRLGTTFVLGVLTYLAYYFFLAGVVLHEPVAGASMHGDALGFLNWVVLWMLWYILFLGSYGIPPMRTGPGDSEPLDATESPLTHGHENPHEHPHYH